MVDLGFEPWEPEETVGKIWHGFATKTATHEFHEDACVSLAEIASRLSVFFRALGGDPAVEIRAVSPEVSLQRLSFRQKLGHENITVPQASFDGEVLRLPDRLAPFASQAANTALYIWLTANAAHAKNNVLVPDLLQADIAAIMHAERARVLTIEAAPGLSMLYDELAQVCLKQRPSHALPKYEAAVEQLVRRGLGESVELSKDAEQLLEAYKSDDFSSIPTPRNYCPFAPVPIWCDIRNLEFSAPSDVATMEAEIARDVDKQGTFRAKRRKSDQAERKDSLILHKFEAILSWAEFINLNRRIDDDDNDDAKKAADDQEEISLGQISKAPATRLKLHLDLAPEDVDRERLSTKCLYPEWDTRTNSYLPDHCSVYESTADALQSVPSFRADPSSSKRIQAVKRQFEALRPGRVFLSGQRDGDELDMDAAVRAQADLQSCGESNDNIWRNSRPEARDLAVSILLDVSRSTESAVDNRAVIDIEREALAALSWGLSACGDDFAVNAFSSLKRERVYVTQCKAFGEAMSGTIEQRIGSLNPGFYTRLGTAIRHVSADLARQHRGKRLLLIITDGKPNDLDHYEGRHGIEDTRMAIREARQAGQSVYGITIDAKGKSWFTRMFGAGGFSVISEPNKLTQALPKIYRQLVIG